MRASYAGRCRRRPASATSRSRQRDRPGWRGARALALLAALTLGGCASTTEAAGPPGVQASRITLGGQPTDLAKLGQLRFEAGFVLGSADPRFGGLSGLWLAPDGSRLLAISDHGTLWRADLEHRADGRLTGLAAWQAIEPGRAPGDPPGRDAEALADDGHGGLVIAYEGVHRLRRVALDDPSGPARPLPTPIALARPSNTGLEALTSLPDGALLALVEGGVRTAEGDLGAWRIAGDQVQALGYVARDGFVPTGADRLDDTIYVVERSFSLLRGFESRIVTLPVAAVRPGARLAGQVLAELRPPLVGENFEGIAVRRGPEGRVLLYLVSDDNFMALERTLLLQFSLPDPARRGAPVAGA